MALNKGGVFVLFLVSLIFLHPYSSADTVQNVTAGSNTTISVLNNTLNMTPSGMVVLVPPNGNLTDYLNVTAELPGNSGLNITVSSEGSISSWITFNGSSTIDFFLFPNETKTINLTVSVPPATSSGYYYANITANTTGQAMKLNLTVNVTQDVGRISVTVIDTIGTPIDSATIFVWNTDPNLEDSGSTDENGTFVSKWLLPGNYSVEANKAGYAQNSDNTTVYGNQNTTNITLVLAPTGAPLLDVSPNSISESAYTDDIIQRTLIISNIGDLNLLNINITADKSWITFSTSFISSLIPSDDVNVYAYIGPISPPGSYTGYIKVNSSNDGNETIPVAFDVQSRPPPPPYEPPPGGGFIPIIPPTPLVKDLEIIDYPYRVNATRGETKLLTVEVRNTGTANLTNASLQIFGNFPYQVTPSSAEIPPGMSKLFLASVSIPADAAYGEYNLLTVASDGNISDSKIIKLDVIEVVAVVEVNETLLARLEELRTLHSRIMNLTGIAERMSYNVSEVYLTLDQMEQVLDDAEDHLNAGDYSSAGDKMDDAKDLAESALELLSKLKKIEQEHPIIDYWIIFWIGLAFAINLIVFIIYYFR
jgi:uncharacterized membrane protein